MTRVKICGLSRVEDIQWANRLRPDYIGFIFAQKSRRYVPPQRAGMLRALLADGIAPVGVFVNEPIPSLLSIARRSGISLIQLHGSEGPDYISALRQATDLPIIRAFSVSSPRDLDAAYASPADHILLDNGAGGTGAAFDWSYLAGFDRPYFLAGGLSPENADRAVSTLHPFALDVSSGVETGGRKDPRKMRALMARVRAAQ